MSPSTNGTSRHRLLELGDLTPDKRAIATIVREGRTETLWGWVDGPRCPGYVKSMVAKHRATYRAAVYRDDDAVFAFDPLAYDTYKRDLLLAVVDGLEYQEAEVLSGDEPTVDAILRALAWIRTEQETADLPEAEGATATPPNRTTAASLATSPVSASRRRKR